MAEEIAKVCDGILCIADNLGLGLATVEFFALDVGQGGGNLAVFVQKISIRERMWASITAAHLRLRWQ